MKLVVYEEATGRIIRNIICPESMKDVQTSTGEAAVFGNNYDPNLYYVSGGVVADRPIPVGVSCSHATITANGIDEVTVSGIPNPSTVLVEVLDAGEGTFFTVEDGQLELTFDTAGSYLITVISAFPNQSVMFTVEAV